MSISVMSKFTSFSAPLAVALSVILVHPAQAVTLNIAPSDTGWWSSEFGHTSDNPNFFVGNESLITFRNYFTFNLAGVTGNITSATLNLFTYNVTSNLGYDLYDVSTSAAALDADSGPNAAIFNDLGTGTLYGSFFVTTGQSNSVVSFTLNAAGIAAINAAQGSFFSIGGAAPTATNNQFIFGGSLVPNDSNTLVLETSAIPEPLTMAGLFVFGGMVVTKRRSIQVATALRK